MKNNAWLTYTDQDKEKLHSFAEDYKSFISNCKTERECISYIVNRVQNDGFEDINDRIASGKPLKEGDKLYSVLMNKTIALFRIGSRPLTDGMNIVCAHIDSPRLDLKQNPLYEDSGLAYFDTHYYGGIKKYQWVTIPLALHGIVVKKDGSIVPVCIGEDPDDPVFCITDLLIHLAGKQMAEKASEVVTGENLDILIGSIPSGDDKEEKAKETVKKNILRLLTEKYGIEEDDFISAEIEAVPAGLARDMGFDRSMILGYGHDDRSCAYPSLEAFMETKDVEYTSCCLLVDKEEIGSVGATGMHSRFFENTVAELLALAGPYSSLAVRRSLARSKMLSSDVGAAYDPHYPDVFDKRNSSFFGNGIILHKFTGARGKSGSNDANPEYIGRLRKIFDDNHVAFQVSELGKVDAGGGGTIAYIAAVYGMEVVDCGVAVLSMHAPFEVISKADLFEAKKAYTAFLANA